jgi:hypothetical protein
MAARYRICAAAAPSPSTIINPLSSPIQYPCGFEAGVQSKINARLGMASELLSQGARHSGGQGIFLDLLHASERTGTQGQRPGGPKELSPGRQPWVQKAWFAGAPAGRKKRFRRGNSPWFCRPLRGLTGAWAWFPGLAPWAKFYRPLGGLPGPPCCRRKLSQIFHAPAAGLPLLCRA